MKVAVLHAMESEFRHAAGEYILAKVIQEWLDAHPDAKIEHIAQSQEGRGGAIYFTILYR